MFTYDESLVAAATKLTELATDRHYGFKASLFEDYLGRKSLAIISPKGAGGTTWIPLSENECSRVQALVGDVHEECAGVTYEGKWR